MARPIRTRDRIIVLISLTFAVAVGFLWLRSLLVLDFLQYVPSQGSFSDWEIISGYGKFQISHFVESNQTPATSAVLLSPMYPKQGWSLELSKSVVQGPIWQAFFNGFTGCGWSCQYSGGIGSESVLRLPYAVPVAIVLVPPSIIAFRRRRQVLANRPGFSVISREA